jgi:hypothetical protein
MILIDLDREARIERALAEIQRAGGLYMREERGHWRPVIGIDLDDSTVYDSGDVRVRGPVTDATLLAVARFGELEELSLSGAHVTDAGLARLEGLKRLRRLNLSRTPLGDAGLHSLMQIPELRTIDLRGTRVSAKGVEDLKRRFSGAVIQSDELDR